MHKILQLTRVGDPVLRKIARRLSAKEIASAATQALIANMRHTLTAKQYGVALAAPQVGESEALVVVGIKPTPNRPGLKPFETVLINPEIVETFGQPQSKWEACMSCGSDDSLLYAQVPRYTKIKLRWLDETGAQREEILEDFVAHVAQHETDHLHGLLFLDKVVDTKSYMMADEYRKRIVKK